MKSTDTMDRPAVVLTGRVGSFTEFTQCSSLSLSPAELHRSAKLSVITKFTTGLLDMYTSINPNLQYCPTKVARRLLTEPAEPKHNERRDNENYDLILKVGDVLCSEPDPTLSAGWKSHTKYTVIDLLGHGTFGQVIKCRSEEDGTLVAIKVLKNKPAYFKQGLYEIGILTLLNQFVDPNGERHTLRLFDHFLFHNHLCIVNELLSINIFELIKQNHFRGLGLRLIQKFISQLLDALIGLEEYEIIHCDLKPENILLENLNTARIRLIDFGSACMEHAPQYSYIQSRHYRAPEVLLGLQYTMAIDMWSVGCIAAELFLGIPLFPGASEYNQMHKITEMLGQIPPAAVIDKGIRSLRMFKKTNVIGGQQQYAFKSEIEYQRDNNVRIDPNKRYFVYRTLKEIVQNIPLRCHSITKEQTTSIRTSLEHFLSGLLQLDPSKRWTARIARAHPFLREGQEELTEPFPSPELLAECERLSTCQPRRATLPFEGFKKTITRETLFPKSVIRSNSTVDYSKAYALFMNGLRFNHIVDIATDIPICPVLEQHIRARNRANEDEDLDFEGMDIDIEHPADKTHIAQSFSNYNLVTPVGFNNSNNTLSHTFIQTPPGSSVNSGTVNSNAAAFGTSLCGSGLIRGTNGNTGINTNTNANIGFSGFSNLGLPSIQLGQSVTDNGLALPPLNSTGNAAPVCAPSARNKWTH